MDRKRIVSQIVQHKKQPNLRYKLKEQTEVFVNHLFYTLFDIDTEVEKNLNSLEKEFDNLVNLACWDIEKPCKKTTCFKCR